MHPEKSHSLSLLRFYFVYQDFAPFPALFAATKNGMSFAVSLAASRMADH
jgi:hypothetical protein